MESERIEAQFDAVVLAGGSGRRMGGQDKAALELGGMNLLERVLSALRDARRTIVVGPRRSTSRTVIWTREDPAGTGPGAALGSGLEHVTSERVAVVAVDHPFIETATVRALLEAIGEHDGAVVSVSGRPQHLVGIYRTVVLQKAFARMEATVGVAIRDVVEGLDLVTIEDPDAGHDVDTWDDVRRANERWEA
jgi:molybdopterin-guanine dinucleotide biosynthesis protein A